MMDFQQLRSIDGGDDLLRTIQRLVQDVVPMDPPHPNRPKVTSLSRYEDQQEDQQPSESEEFFKFVQELTDLLNTDGSMSSGIAMGFNAGWMLAKYQHEIQEEMRKTERELAVMRRNAERHRYEVMRQGSEYLNAMVVPYDEKLPNPDDVLGLYDVSVREELRKLQDAVENRFIRFRNDLWDEPSLHYLSIDGMSAAPFVVAMANRFVDKYDAAAIHIPPTKEGQYAGWAVTAILRETDDWRANPGAFEQAFRMGTKDSHVPRDVLFYSVLPQSYQFFNQDGHLVAAAIERSFWKPPGAGGRPWSHPLDFVPHVIVDSGRAIPDRF